MLALAPHVAALGLSDPPAGLAAISIGGHDPILPAHLRVGEAAAVALALGGSAADALHEMRGGAVHEMRGAAAARVSVDVGHAAASLLGFLLQVRADGAPHPDLLRAQPATIGFFATADGRHIHLHGGFPALHAGTLALLGCADDAAAIAAAVAEWNAFELEDALAEAGLCGAVARSPEEWDAHAQARALRARPVVSIERIGDAPPEPLPPAARPLEGVRVLDLTRVLAGPTSGRTLAQYGADVLRVGAARLPCIPAFVRETGHGKRSTFLDLDVPADRARLDALLEGADVFTDGFRAGALDQRGYSSHALATRRPGIVHVNVRCYGDHGPWAGRRGWEQLAQTASGVAWIEGGAASPRLLPAAATDYTTGYLAAYGAIEALRRRATQGGSWRVEVSLTRTAMWLRDLGIDLDPLQATGLPPLDAIRARAASPEGEILHVKPAVSLSSSPVEWTRPLAPLGADRAEWSSAGRSAGPVAEPAASRPDRR